MITQKSRANMLARCEASGRFREDQRGHASLELGRVPEMAYHVDGR